jgi:hypothetical protein
MGDDSRLSRGIRPAPTHLIVDSVLLVHQAQHARLAPTTPASTHTSASSRGAEHARGAVAVVGARSLIASQRHCRGVGKRPAICSLGPSAALGAWLTRQPKSPKGSGIRAGGAQPLPGKEAAEAEAGAVEPRLVLEKSVTAQESDSEGSINAQALGRNRLVHEK